MVYHSLLWATGADRPGIVAAVTRVLFENNCNIEDSSMLQLGSEFAMLLIFSSEKPLSPSRTDLLFKNITKKYLLSIGVKSLSKKQAQFKPVKKELHMVSLHGADRPGLVYRLTDCLAKNKFNITDLVTHRTSQGSQPGYVLFVEGELGGKLSALEKDLAALAKKLATPIHIRALPTNTI